MNNARIERMIREVNAEPAAQFFGSLIALVERHWPRVNMPATASAPAKARLSYK
jgi:hypothetical protein